MTGAVNDPIKVYLDSMEDVKARLRIIKQILDGESPLGDEGLDGEIVCLMLRKVLEQIAFASLAAHKSSYEAVHEDSEYTWRAKRLLERLSKIHPKFYPVPVRPSRETQSAGHHHFEQVEDYLTQDEFVLLYDTASGALHVWNPYKNGARILDFKRSIAEWVQRIEALLTMHWIQLLGSDESWLIQMDHPDDHKVHGFTAKAVNPEDAPPAIQDAVNRLR